jgi:pimeloyl-ACP methyl ester carboxylesterase
MQIAALIFAISLISRGRPNFMVTFAELQTQARPMRWYIKLLSAVLSLVFFAVLATLAIAGFLVYRIIKPQRTSSEINMQSFPGRPDAMQFSVPGAVGTREGWFFPGFRGASTIVLCHGYGSSKGELLTLVSALQDHQYNVFVFDFTAHGANDGITSFGYHEADEVRAAVDAVASRNDINPASFGLWGYNLGAYAALREAESDQRVRALVLDSVYDLPEQMVKVGVERQGLGGFPLMTKSAEFSFQWLNHQYRGELPLSNTKRMASLAGVQKLFINAADEPELGDITRQMYLKAPEPKDQANIGHGNFADMGDDDKRAYENRVVSFFLLRLPPTGGAAH